jgi:hypothetical protein
MEKVNYEKLKVEDKKTLQSVYSNYDKLWEFQCKVNQNLMVYLFGENMGEHYWDKFTREHDRNIMRLMRGMDSDKKGDLVANIFFNKNLYAHT